MKPQLLGCLFVLVGCAQHEAARQSDTRSIKPKAVDLPASGYASGFSAKNINQTPASQSHWKLIQRFGPMELRNLGNSDFKFQSESKFTIATWARLYIQGPEFDTEASRMAGQPVASQHLFYIGFFGSDGRHECALANTANSGKDQNGYMWINSVGETLLAAHITEPVALEIYAPDIPGQEPEEELPEVQITKAELDEWNKVIGDENLVNNVNQMHQELDRLKGR